MSYFNNKTAIVTGGAQGIGRALAEELLARGAGQVILADIDHAKAEATAKELGSRTRATHLDVRDATKVRALIEEVDESGGLDLMFNNAGIAIVGDAEELSLADYDRLIDINIRGVVHGTVAAFDCMRRRGCGHIVNIASVAGLIPAPGFSAYALTKHAVAGYTKSLRVEAAMHGVKLSAVCPGFIDTPMLRNTDLRGQAAAERDRLLERLPIYSARACARDALNGVAKNRAEIVITKSAKIAYAAHRAAPELNAQLLKSRYPRLRRGKHR